MRDMLAHADLARYAGQFVWLEVNFDVPGNAEFLAKYGANATPTFLVVDPHSETVAVMVPGAMSVEELKGFLEHGAAIVLAKLQTPADQSLRNGDQVLEQHPAEAAQAYKHALELASTDWPKRALAEASLVKALQDSQQWQFCAEKAAKSAALMRRDELFVRTLVGGMWCLASADSATWVNTQLRVLQPMAEEALRLPLTVRDHRDSIYRTLMYVEVTRGNQQAALKWGERWLQELEGITPRSNDERSALDIARVENIQIVGDPLRILPALKASEKAMPNDYNASLRVAQMELSAKEYDAAISACDRGLTRSPGAVGRTWLLRLKAEAFKGNDRSDEARQTLSAALKEAEKIPAQRARENNIASIKRMLDPVAIKAR